MLTWPLIFLLVVGCTSLVAAAVLFATDPKPRTRGRTPARSNEQYTPRIRRDPRITS